MNENDILHDAIDRILWDDEQEAERKAAIVAEIKRREARDPDICPGAIPEFI